MQLGLAGADRDAEHRCRFFMRVTVDPDQHQRLACARRQPRDRLLEVDRGSGIAARRVGQRLGDDSSADVSLPRTSWRRRPRASTALTAMRCSQVPKAAAALERGQAAPGLHEGLLGTVLGGGRVALSCAGRVHTPCRRGSGTAPRTRPAEPRRAESTSARSSAARRARSNSDSAPGSANPHLGAGPIRPAGHPTQPRAPTGPEDRPLES